MKRQTRAPSARLFFVDDPRPPAVPRRADDASGRVDATPADAEPPQSPPPRFRRQGRRQSVGSSCRVSCHFFATFAPVAAPVAVAPAPAPVGVVAAPAPAPRQLPEAVPETTLGRFSLLQKQLQALDAAAANEKAAASLDPKETARG